MKLDRFTRGMRKKVRSVLSKLYFGYGLEFNHLSEPGMMATTVGRGCVENSL